jgi:hypothetical protein
MKRDSRKETEGKRQRGGRSHFIHFFIIVIYQSHGKRQRERDRGKETEGKRQRGGTKLRDGGEQIKTLKTEGRDIGGDTEGRYQGGRDMWERDIGQETI